MEVAGQARPHWLNLAHIDRTALTPPPPVPADKEPTSRSDWERVVAVVCSGKAWQFKKWPFKVGAAAGQRRGITTSFGSQLAAWLPAQFSSAPWAG